MSAIQLPACVDVELGYKDKVLTGPVTIDKDGVLITKGTCVINGNVCIENGGDLEISPGSDLTINGTLCIEIGGSAATVQTEYENYTWENGGGSLTVTGTVTIAADCDCDGCD